ncbi:uncharacterized protein ACLA_030460 [Aspergillus clavatus NRRL 1]|uniref:Uncharacterized protein n=1 Tax=Aspergillus clavatus (strain ATCC 1007 / CBS 513.65 / DSM 816 / NCTC 3887 / NRRL 1 / QM 1276 / 107) TaxID=344612 RepID=A1CRP2_ASPCL|nr:uncharacterized protein ACLA_030460 [Aspergillus clavatus NRRL 1]EAW08313.1 conserved hypothetical protein [Aspergillus clavatus NRRL 1]
MGQRVSAIHSVKSENYYEKGNAINEIWIGNVELLSRLPFGDSDLAQASWPIGGWPKIPWHNFIIPLKRRAFSFYVGDGDGDGPHPLSKEAMTSARPSVHLSRGKLLIAVTVLSLLFLSAVYVPVALRQHTAPYGWDTDSERRRQQKRRLATRTSIASVFLFAALVITALQFHLWTMIRYVFSAKGAGFLILGITWATVGVIGHFFAVKAVTLLWLDWRDARRAAAEDLSQELVEKELPGILVSWLQRQHRA